MNKLWIIFRREYVTRVRKKSFIIGTLLAPLGLAVYFLVIFGLSRYQGGAALEVAVLDETGMIGRLPDEKGLYFKPSAGKSLEALLDEVRADKLDGVLRVPPLKSMQQKDLTVFYHSNKKLAPEKSEFIRSRLSDRVREFKIDSLRLDRTVIESLRTKIAIEPERLDGEKKESRYTAGVGLAIGGIMAFIMFFMVLMYGQMVMRSVMEEKTNRIVEVMMSSVKPFELMMGKILGAGAVGLTQVLAWIVLGGGVTFIMPLILGFDPSAMEPPGADMAAGQTIDPDEAQAMAINIMSELGRQNWWAIGGSFIVFFIGGYFIYASLFAAIGSAMGDDYGEGQALVLPATLPIILAFYIVAFVGMRSPDSGLMVFASLFPLFSPIAMPFRMAFDPPVWQVVLSLMLVVGASFFFVWLSGRIYRVGILLYGKKVTLKELGKWIFYR